MSTYRNIHGRSIKAVATDPTAEVTEGEIWYNTASDTFKTVLVSEAWSSAASLITPRTGGAAFGTQTATGYGCGYTTTYTAVTEEYNGTGWATGGGADRGRYQ